MLPFLPTPSEISAWKSCFTLEWRIVRGGGCPVVMAQWQSTGYTSQVSWVQFPATAGLFTFLYFSSKTSIPFVSEMRLDIFLRPFRKQADLGGPWSSDGGGSG